MVDPIAAILLIASPWIFGFSNVNDATIAAVVIGAIMLVEGQTTRWRLSVAKILPFRTHFRMDIVLPILLIAMPFILGDGGIGAVTRFFVIFGALKLVANLMTDWDPELEVHPAGEPHLAR